jgi:hypothetical protein
MPDCKTLRLVHLTNLPKFTLAGRRVLPSNHTAAFAACLLKSMVDPLLQRPDVPVARIQDTRDSSGERIRL